MTYEDTHNTRPDSVVETYETNGFSHEITLLFKKSGKAYLDGLVELLCELTGATHSLVGSYNKEGKEINTLSFYAKEGHLNNFSYSIEKSPCEQVIGDKQQVYFDNVQELFPEDEKLKFLGATSYIGIPLFDLSNNLVGVVTIMHDEPIICNEQVRFMLDVIKSKTEFELERIFLQKNELFSMRNFMDVFENFQDVFFYIRYNENNEQVDFVISPSVEKTLGYTNEEIKELNFSNFYANPTERKTFLQLIKVEKKVKNYPVTFKKKDGTIIHVEIDCEFLKSNSNGNGEFALRGVLKDVTQSFKENLRFEIAYLIAEKSQRRAINLNRLGQFIHETLKEVINISNFYIVVNDQENDQVVFPYFKDELTTIKENTFSRPFNKRGFTEHILRSNNPLIHDKKELQQIIAEKQLEVKGEMPEHFIGIQLKSEGLIVGAIVAQSYHAKAVFEKEDVELVKFIASQVGVIIDRKLWQDKLVENEKYFRSLVENSSEIIGIINEDGVIEYVSESTHRIVGYYPHELIGRNIAELIKIDGGVGTIKDRILNPDTESLEIFKLFDKQGKKKYLEVTIANNYINNTINGVIVNAKDITNKVIADKKRENAQKRLSALQQVQRTLISDKSLVEILNDAIEVISGSVHDIDRISIGLLHPELESLEIIALQSKCTKEAKIKVGDLFPYKELLSFESMINKEPFYIADIDQLETISSTDIKKREEGILSYYIKPIIINEEVIGTLNMGSMTKNYFDEIDKDLIDEITLLLAVVINDAILKQEIAEREEDLTTIFNSTSEGILKISGNNKLLVVNKGMCDMLGYTEEEMLTKFIGDITYAGDEGLINSILDSLETDRPDHYVVNKRLVHKNGNLLDCRINVIPFYDGDHNFDHSIAFVYNETERKKAEKEVTDLRRALDHTSSIFITNPSGVIIDMNKKLEQLSGYEREEIIGKKPNMFNSNYHTDNDWKELWETILEGKTYSGEHRNQKKDGSIYWVYITISPSINDNGVIEKYIAIQIDITEQKEAKNNTVREVIEAQESERERFAMEIHDGLGQVLLAAKMNLTAISDSMDGLDKDSQDIFNTSLHLLTDAIHEARSISHGLMSRVLNKFGLAYAIDEIVQNINNTTPLTFVFQNNIEALRFDEEKEMGIYRTLQELIKNIIKHSKSTKAKLSMIKEENRLHIVIEDNGVGINSKTIDDPSSGGIGLRNMRSRIEYLGGSFYIEEKVKIGTKIKISIVL